MQTSVLDACERLLVTFGVQSRHDAGSGLLEVLQDGEPHTPANAAEIAAAVALWKPLSLSADRTTIPADGVTPATVTVRSSVASVALWIGGVAHVVALVDGVGTVEIVRDVITLPPHIVVKAQEQAVFGYAQVVIAAE